MIQGFKDFISRGTVVELAVDSLLAGGPDAVRPAEADGSGAAGS